VLVEIPNTRRQAPEIPGTSTHHSLKNNSFSKLARPVHWIWHGPDGRVRKDQSKGNIDVRQFRFRPPGRHHLGRRVHFRASAGFGRNLAADRLTPFERSMKVQ
jgi:hypothetical protein